ncbi:MAG: RNA polymerase sigma factor [Deltaproteobacteria bacterium]|nr:RNA polymerase sigma factor [Deltaproteobacteria bacterium]
MAAYAQGDRRAFEALFSRLGPRVHGFFLRRFGSPAVADDLMQLTFLKVHRARAEYRTGEPVRPWVFTIAARVRVDELRRRGRRPERTGVADLEPRIDPADPPQLDAATALEHAEKAAQVRAALEGLPESQRVVVHLHRYEGMTFDEIAKLLGTTEGAVKLRAFRAYEQLRKRLAPLIAEREAV